MAKRLFVAWMALCILLSQESWPCADGGVFTVPSAVAWAEPVQPETDPTASDVIQITEQPTAEVDPSASPTPQADPSQGEPNEAAVEATLPPESPSPTSESPFSAGYVYLKKDTTVYRASSLREALGVLPERCVAYAYDRVEADSADDAALAVAFATEEEGVLTGYVKPDTALKLNEVETGAYRDAVRTSWRWDSSIPLDDVAFEPTYPDPEPSPSVSTVEPVSSETPQPLEDGQGKVTGESAQTAEASQPAEAEETFVPAQSSIAIRAVPNPVMVGERVTLYAAPDNIASALWQWQYAKDNLHWTDIPDADGLQYEFVSDAENVTWYYRIVALEPSYDQADSGQGGTGPSAETATPDEAAQRLDDSLSPSALAEGETYASGSFVLGLAGEGVARIGEAGGLYPSLEAAIEAADEGATIVIVDDIRLTATIELSKSVAIASSGAHTVSGGRFVMLRVVSGALSLGVSGDALTFDGGSSADSEYSVVEVMPGASLDLGSRATLKGGHAERGGGVRNRGSFTLSGGAILGSTGTLGGGVYNAADAQFVLKSGTIRGNASPDAGGMGGGVYNEGTMMLSGGTVEGNSAGGSGGGVYSVGDLTMSGGTASDNTAAVSGGGILNGGVFRLSGGTLRGNSAGECGGGVANLQTMMMTGGALLGNRAKRGGGLYTSGALRLAGGSAEDNSASEAGDGICLQSGAAFSFSVAKDAAIEGDVYLAEGTAVSVDTSVESGFAGTMRLTPCRYEEGVRVLAEADGGYDAATRAHLGVAGSNADGWTIDEGGLLRKITYVATILGEKYESLEAALAAAPESVPTTIELAADVSLAAPLIIGSGKLITLTSCGACRIARGEAMTGPMLVVQSGGALTLGGGPGQLKLDGRGVQGDDNYIVHISRGGNLTIASGAVLTGGNATDSPGCVYSAGTATMTGGSIAKNKGQNGGGIYLDASQAEGTFLMSGGRICQNTALVRGGGVFADGDFTLSGGRIDGNTSGDCGGGISSDGQLTVSGGEVYDNTAVSGGGMAGFGTMALKGGSLHDNQAKYGGGVYAGADVPLTVTGGAVLNNAASMSGGGIYGDSAILEFSSGTQARIEGNRAPQGGGIYAFRGSVDAQEGAELSIKGNEADRGGGLYAYLAQVAIAAGTFENNKAVRGGGIYNEGTLAISGGAFDANQATEAGGALYQNGTLTLSGGTFRYDDAPLGGGLYTSVNGKSSILDTAVPFLDSTLYFGRAPQYVQPVRLELSSHLLGAYLVQAPDPAYIPTSGFILPSLEGEYGLNWMAYGGGYALWFGLSTTVELTLTGSPFVYGQTYAPIAVVKQGGNPVDGAQARVLYSTSANGTFTETVPSQAGSYIVKAIYDGNLALGLGYSEASAAFRIDPVTPEVTFDDVQATYTGKKVVLPSATVRGYAGAALDCTISYTFYSDAQAKKKLNSTPIQPGTYYAVATVSRQANINAASSRIATVVISKITGFAFAAEDAQPVDGEYLLTRGEVLRTTTTIEPAWVSCNDTCTSSNPQVAAVEEDGLIRAVGGGTATVTATARDIAGSGKWTRTLRIRVFAPVTGVTLPARSAVIEGKTNRLAAVVEPSSASVQTLTWRSENLSIATVSSDGTVKGVAAGETIITATSQNGISAQSTLRVMAASDQTVSITISSPSDDVPTGETIQLIASTQPATAFDEVIWTSSSLAYATVDEFGLVTGIKPGQVTITAAATDGSGVRGSFTLNVITPVTSVSLSGPDSDLYVGQSAQIKAAVSPSDATYKTVTWSSDSPDALSVTSAGLIKGITAGGPYRVTATAHNGVSASVDVYVRKPVTSIALSTDSGSPIVTVGGTARIAALIAPEDAYNTSLTWSSSNTSYAKVDASGLVSCIKPGQVTITAAATDGSGVRGSFTLNVVTPVTGVSLSGPDSDLYVSQSAQWKAAVSPSSATYKTLTWSSDNPDALSVSSSGLIRGITAGGPYRITATAYNGISASADVYVRQSVTSITLSTDSGSAVVNAGEKLRVAALIAPEDAYNTNLTWSSSNDSYAKVDASGLVTCIKPGQVTIYAAATDGSGVRGSFALNVTISVTGVSLSNPDSDLYVGKSSQLAAAVSPSNATYKTLTWISDDPDALSVSSAGLITGIQPGGPYRVTATAHNGISASVDVYVRKPVTSITLSTENGSSIASVGGTMRIAALIVPEDAYNTGLTWSSSNTSYAKVDASGLVTGIKPGQVTITAAATDGSGVRGSFALNVIIPVTGVSLSGSGPDLFVGRTAQLTAAVSPSNATNKTLTWSSDHPDALSVSSSGLITGIKPGGPYRVTVTAHNGVSAGVDVYVRKPVTSITLLTDSGRPVGNTGEMVRMVAQISPEDAYNATLTWSSSNTRYATVDTNGLVTCIKPGQVTITATATDGSGVRGSFALDVTTPVTSVTLPARYAVIQSKTNRLTAVLEPSGASIQTLTWSSSDLTIATVADDGTVKGVAEGEAIITATSNNGLSAQCTLYVMAAGDQTAGIKVSSPFGIEVPVGTALQLNASTEPATAFDGLTWTSSNLASATVDEFGLVTCLKTGQVTIYAAAVDGSGVRGSIVLNGIIPVTGVSVSGPDVYTGQSAQLKVTVSPSTATYKTLTWLSDSPDALSVSPTGLITGIQPGGPYRVTAVAHNGVSAGIDVYVRKRVISITLTTESGQNVVFTGTTVPITALVTPDGTTNADLTWSSSNTRCAKVDAAGVVSCIKPGQVTITAAATDGSKVRGSIVLTVVTPVTGVSLTGPDVYIGQSTQLKAVVSPSDATDKALTWSSDNPDALSVSSTGLIKGIQAGGPYRVTAVSNNGISANIDVYVRQPVTSITLSTDIGYPFAYTGDTVPITALITPGGTYNADLMWSSSNSRCATVDSSGNVKGIGTGTVKITAKAKDGRGATATISLTFAKPDTSIALNASSVTLYTNGAPFTSKLSVKVSPSGALCRNLTYQVVKGDAVQVGADGQLTAVKAGVATVRATTQRGSAAECTVTVYALPTKLTLPAILAVSQKQVVDLGAMLVTDGSPEALTWSSSDRSVATVSASGVAIASGTKTGVATITVKSKNGKQATCVLVVERAR